MIEAIFLLCGVLFGIAICIAGGLIDRAPDVTREQGEAAIRAHKKDMGDVRR